MEEQIALGDDYKIINDKTDAAGVRHITAAPSALVCSKQIDFDIVDGRSTISSTCAAVTATFRLSEGFSRECLLRRPRTSCSA